MSRNGNNQFGPPSFFGNTVVDTSTVIVSRTLVASPTVSSSQSTSLGNPTFTSLEAPNGAVTSEPGAATSTMLSAPTTTFIGEPLAATQGETGGITAGAAVGIGIGCTIAGALLAALLLFIFGRKRKREYNFNSGTEGFRTGDRSLDCSSPVPDYNSLPALAAAATTTTSHKAAPFVTVSDNPVMNEVVDEQPVRQAWARLEAKAREHVLTMYHGDYVKSDAVSQDPLDAILSADARLTAVDVRPLLLQESTRATAILFVIWNAICPRLDFYGDPRKSLFPPEILTCISSMGGQLLPKAQLTQWRIATAPLISSQYSIGSIPRSDPRSAAVTGCLNLLTPILRPFIQESRIAQAFEDLEDILEQAAAFGLLLLSSKGTWGFSREVGEKAWAERGEMPGWPGLTRTDVERVLLRRSLFSDGTLAR